MKIILILLSLTSFNIYAVCGDSANNSGINTLITDGCNAGNVSDRAVILERQINSGEEVRSQSLNLKFNAISEAITALTPIELLLAPTLDTDFYLLVQM